jgi:tetratricopeptide (TPR) repeat protein
MAVLKTWLIDQTIDFGIALAIILALCCATGGILKTQNQTWIVAWAFALVVCCTLLQPLSTHMNQRALNRMHNDDIEKYRKALEFDPSNASAHRFLGDIYFKQDRYDDAIVEYKAAIKLDPHDVVALRRKLNYVLDLRLEAQHGHATLPGTNQPAAAPSAPRQDVTMCPSCRMDTPSDGKTCVHCGEQLNMGFSEWLMQPDNFRDVMRQSTVAMVVAVILLTVFTSLPLEVKACVLCASALVGGVYLLRSTGA